jgi:homoserine dehydrogenase
MAEPLKIGLAGLGTVGTAVVDLLERGRDKLIARCGRPIEVVAVGARSRSKKRAIDLKKFRWIADPAALAADPAIDVFVEVIGGAGDPARRAVETALAAGKPVVTANKALLARHGHRLAVLAERHQVALNFEASVAGGIPIITNISQCLSANQIESLTAILNGTSNFILTQMEEQGAPYADAVKEAQRLGFAEADPTMDVDGSDASQKLAILAHLAFGARVHWSEIPRGGIDKLDVADLQYAGELGYRIKLLAVAQLVSGGLELHVSPTLVKSGTPLAEVRGAYNAVTVRGDAVGRLFFHGLGAGQMPTASAVVADLIDTVVGRTAITFRTLELWSQRESPVAASDPANVTGRYYMRFHVDDRPGVMSDITGVLGRHGISIASVIQHEPSTPEAAVVPLVIITHNTTEGVTRKAVDQINRLPSVRPGSVRMQIRD